MQEHPIWLANLQYCSLSLGFQHEELSKERLCPRALLFGFLLQPSVLILAGVELIFFRVASMRLHFGSVLKTGKFSLLLSSAYTMSRPFLLLTPPHQRVGWGCTRSWDGTLLGQLAQTNQRGISYHMKSHAAYKAGGRRRKGGMFRMTVFCLPK